MMINRSRLLATLFVVVLTFAATGLGGGKAGGSGFSISWYTVDGGGGESVSSNFSVRGTIGQHDAGSMQSSGAATGGFILNGGYWSGFSHFPCLGNTNGDNAVNVDDLLAVIAQWGNPGGSADVNKDGTVNVDDLLLVISRWGPCPT